MALPDPIMKSWQQKLIDAAVAAGKPNPLPQYGADGLGGHETQQAIRDFQASNGLAVTGQFDQPTRDKLNPPKPKGFTMPDFGIPASISDYALNFITSKINWFAALMTGVIVTFVNTKFGLNLDAGTQAAITTILVTIMMGGVWLLRTFLSAPKVVTKAPLIVTTNK